MITDQSATISIISTNINTENGDIESVKTINGYTFDSDGLNIATNQNTYNTQITNDGTYYKDGDTILGQTTKDGSKFKDMDLFGEWRYGKEDIDDEAMFVAELYTDANGEECFGHFFSQ